MGHRRQKHCQELGYVDDRRGPSVSVAQTTDYTSQQQFCRDLHGIQNNSDGLRQIGIALHGIAIRQWRLLYQGTLTALPLNYKLMAKEVVKKQMRRNVWSWLQKWGELERELARYHNKQMPPLSSSSFSTMNNIIVIMITDISIKTINDMSNSHLWGWVKMWTVGCPISETSKRKTLLDGFWSRQTLRNLDFLKTNMSTASYSLVAHNLDWHVKSLLMGSFETYLVNYEVWRAPILGNFCFLMCCEIITIIV